MQENFPDGEVPECWEEEFVVWESVLQGKNAKAAISIEPAFRRRSLACDGG
jgi:hypothetical protein